MLSAQQRQFLNNHPVAVLATADESGQPHAVPVCFTLAGETAYITIDEKPKRIAGTKLKRLRNIAENAKVALLVQHYDHQDWNNLAWVMVQGAADILLQGPEHQQAQALLRERYRQLRQMNIAKQPVIAIRISRCLSWWAQPSDAAKSETKE